MNIIARAQNIILRPQTEWDVISAEVPDKNKIITGYVLPLILFAAIASFIGYAFVGVSTFGVRFYGISWGLYQGLSTFISSILSVYITSLVIDSLAPNFNSPKDFGRSLQLVAYSFTPIWIGGLLSIFPPLAIVGSLLGLYGLYLMYIGIPVMKHTPQDKQTSYFVISLIVVVVVYIVIGWILTRILMSSFNLAYYYPGQTITP